MSTDPAAVELSVQEYVRRMAGFLADNLEGTVGEGVKFSLIVFDADGPGSVVCSGTADLKESAARIQHFLENHQRVQLIASEPAEAVAREPNSF